MEVRLRIQKVVLTVLILAICIAIVGCKKKSDSPVINATYDTLRPLSYFPVLPGSFWKYKEWNKSSGDTLIRIDTTSNKYILHQYQFEIDSFSVPVYVPFLNGSPIYEYDRISCNDYGYHCCRYPILSEQIGYSFGRYIGDPRFNPWFIETIVFEKRTDNLGDSILILKTYHINKSEPMALPSQFVDWTIYKKNIGLFFNCSVDTTINDTIQKRWLIDFSIND